MFRTDGTFEGTFPVLEVANDQLYNSDELIADEEGNVTFVLGNTMYKTDGTAEGTHELLSISPRYPGDATFELWATPTEGDSVRLLAHSQPFSFSGFTYSVGGVFLFTSQRGNATQLWRTDGTTDGTRSLGYTSSSLFTSEWIGNQGGRAWFSSGYTTISSTDGETLGVELTGDIGGSAYFVENGNLLFNNASLRFGPYRLSQHNGPLTVGSFDGTPQVSVVGDVTYSVGVHYFDRETRLTRWTLSPQYSERVLEPTVAEDSIELLDDAYRRNFVEPRREKPVEQPLFAVEETDGSRMLFAFDGGLVRNVIDQVEGDLDWQYTADGFFYTGEPDGELARKFGETGREPIFSDGTVEGTTPIDLWPGAGSSRHDFVNWLPATLVVANHPEFGRELWLLAPEDELDVDVTLDPLFEISEFDVLELSIRSELPEDAAIAWDLDNDGEFDDAFGADAVVPWDELEDAFVAAGIDFIDEPLPIRVRVELDGRVGDAQSSLHIVNVPSVIEEVRMPDQIVPVEEVHFEVVGREVESIVVRFNDEVELTPDGTTFSRSFDEIGVYEMTVSATDPEGETISESFSVRVDYAEQSLAWLFEPGEVFGGRNFSADVSVFRSRGEIYGLSTTVFNDWNRTFRLDRDARPVEVGSGRSGNPEIVGGRSIYADGPFVASFDGVEYQGGLLDVPMQGVKSYDVAVGDVDGDSDLDVYIANWQDGDGVPASDWVMLNDGAGNYIDSGQSLGNYESRSVEFGDLDNDGDVDAVTAGKLPDGNHIWFNDGVGRFQEGEQLLQPGGEHVAMADVDGDGDLDLFGVTNGPNYVWLNDGAGSFTDSGQRLGNSNSSHVQLGDLDLDGDLDAWVANWEGDASTIWINDGLGQFRDSGARIAPSHSTEHVVLEDLDGDSDLDVATVSWGQTNHIYLNSLFEPDRTRPVVVDLSFAVVDGTLQTVTAKFTEAIRETGRFAFDLRSEDGATRVLDNRSRDPEGAWDSDTLTMTWDLAAWTDVEVGPGRWVGELHSGGYEDLAGNNLIAWPLEVLVTWNADIDNDLDVDFSDYLVLSRNFGVTDANRQQGDLDGNGVVEFADFLLLSSDFNRGVQVRRR